MRMALTDARGDVANAHGGLASEVRQLADVVESPARSNRDKKRPMDCRDEADGASRATRLDERPPDASKDKFDEHIDGTLNSETVSMKESEVCILLRPLPPPGVRALSDCAPAIAALRPMVIQSWQRDRSAGCWA